MMSNTQILQSVVDDLFGKLKEPDEIAAICRGKELQGFVGNITSCPMVKLVRGKVDFFVAFTVGNKFGTGRWVWYDYERHVTINASLVCEQFSNNFDAGMYPELIANLEK